MIEMTCHVNHLFDLWQRCSFSGIEALEFQCIYQYPRKACDRRRIPVVAISRTISIQKQMKSKYPEVGSEKPLAGKSCFV